MAFLEQFPPDADEYPEWARQIIRDSYARRFKDPADLELLTRLSEAFSGATCPEAEVRFLGLLGYAAGVIPENAKNVLQKPIVSPQEVLVVGKAGINIPDLTDEELDRATTSIRHGERMIALPALRLAPYEPVLDLTGNRIKTTVLVKNPFYRIKGETFQWVRAEGGGWMAPLAIGAQNGLILKAGKLFIVEGAKNREEDVYEWRAKRPVFDNGKYEAMNVFMEILRAKDFTLFL